MIRLIYCTLLITTYFNLVSQVSSDEHEGHANCSHPTARQDSVLKWIDINKINEEILLNTNMPTEYDNAFLQLIYPEEIALKIKIRTDPTIQSANDARPYIEKYVSEMKKRYQSYKLSPANQDLSKVASINDNGACGNIDFEQGLSEWTGDTARNCSQANANRPLAKCNTNNSLVTPRRQQITTLGTMDPLIPTLSTSYPLKGRQSVRIEDYQAERDRVSGNVAGVMSSISHTFVVTPDNNLLTYHYAAVLEDPGDDNNHVGFARPHFIIRLRTANGTEIPCASYTVVVDQDLVNFQRVRVGSGNNAMTLYYRDWSTVSVPLTDYMGETLTITFSASDCAPGGHLGYAYVDAECAPIKLPQDTTICGTETKTMLAPDGFASYSWTGPGIVGVRNSQTVSYNRAGVYTVTLTPFADDPCPITMTYTVVQVCPTTPIRDTLCATINSPLSRAGVNLNSYNARITALYTGTSGITVRSWHTGKPATAANRVTAPTNVTVNNLQRYFAVTSFPDTVELSFVITSLPSINFPAVASACEGSAAFQIRNVTPVGGVFSGSYTSSTGMFNPSLAGVYNVKYRFVNASGCADSTTQPITVVRPPTVSVNAVAPLCTTADSVSVTGSSANTSSVLWIGGAGSFKNSTSASTFYFPTDAEKNSTSPVVIGLRGIANTPCTNVERSINISFVQHPRIDAQPVPVFCADASTVPVLGTGQNYASVAWTGGSGVWNNANTLNATYTPTLQEKMSVDTIVFTVTARGNTPCPDVQDQTRVSFVPLASVSIPPVSSLCEISDSIQILATSQNTLSTAWSGSGGVFGNINALQTYYYPSQAEKAAGSVSLTLTGTAKTPCPNVTDSRSVALVAMPTLEIAALPDICANQNLVTLNTSMQNVSQLVWTPKSGTFSDLSSPNPTYTLTEAELSDSVVSFIATGQGNAPCPSVSDTVLLRIAQLPHIDIFPISPICVTSDSFKIDFTTENVRQLDWNIGNGTGVLQNFGTNSILYYPSNTEKGFPDISIRAEGLGSNICPAAVDTSSVILVQNPYVMIDNLNTVCSDFDSVVLVGSHNHTASLLWSGGHGGLFQDHNTSSTVYYPNEIDKSMSKINFVLLGMGNTPCENTVDTVELNIVPLPKIDAQDVMDLCADVDSVLVTVNSASYLSSVSWIGNGGVFRDADSLTAYYFPSDPEKALGQTNIKIEGNAIAPCSNIEDSITIRFVNPPTVDILPSGPFCSDIDELNLQASGNHMSGVQWSGGSGTFTNLTTLTTTYTPSNTERNGSMIQFVLKAEAIAPCKYVEDTMLLRLYPLPPSFDVKVPFCDDENNTAVLDAGVASKYIWVGMSDTTRFVTASDFKIFQINVMNEFGCEATRTIETVKECPPRLFISNAFTPNSDKHNDKYTVYGAHIGKFHMLIFNRWGEIIFESNDMSDVWDGNYRQEPMPIGVYPWIITYEGDSEKYRGPYEMKGSVTVVR